MKFLLEHGAAILGADPGVGKSSITLGAFKVLRKQGVAAKMLVICPLKPAYITWPKEVSKWLDFADFKIVVLHGKTRDEKLIADADICVINPEGIDWLIGAKRVKSSSGRVSVAVDLKRFKSFGFDTLTIDELTKFKACNTGRFKVLKAVHQTFARRWGLTGSLVANGLLDLFGQCLIIDEGRTFGPFVTAYRTRYFTQSYDGFSWKLQPDGEQRILERLAPLVFRQAAEGLPPLVDVVRNVELPAPVRKVYDALETEMFAELDGRTITAANAGVMTVKLRQVASGGLYLQPDVLDLLGRMVPSGKREWVNLHTEKLDAVESLLEELQGAPLLVAYDFEHDLDRFRERFGKDVPYIGGGVPPKRFKELEAAWNAGELPMLLGHPRSMAHGLNLQERGAHVCWHTLTWDYELYDQLIRRLLRRGSAAPRVFNYHLIAKGTIDETVYWALRSKAKGQAALYEGLLALRKK